MSGAGALIVVVLALGVLAVLGVVIAVAMNKGNRDWAGAPVPPTPPPGETTPGPTPPDPTPPEPGPRTIDDSLRFREQNRPDGDVER